MNTPDLVHIVTNSMILLDIVMNFEFINNNAYNI